MNPMLPALLLAALAPQQAFGSLDGPWAEGDRRFKANVLVVVLDDVAERDIDLVRTPSFDALAQRGTRYLRAYGAPTCSPARRMLHFGTYWTADSGDPCTGGSKPFHPPVGDLSLPKLFEGANYHTALFGKWHLGGYPAMDLGAPWELAAQAHGYEVWRAGVGANVKGRGCPTPPGNYTDWNRVADGASTRSSQYQTWAVRDDFLAWHDALPPDEPWYAMVCFQAPHAPFHIPPNYPQGQLLLHRDRYELMLEEADRALGAILARVDPARTLVLVVGDNGTPSGVVNPAQDPSKVKSTTYEDGIRVPMVFAGPGVGQGRASESVVSFVDVLPTFAELLGVDVRPRGARDGVSLVPTFRDPGFRPRAYAFAGLTNPTSRDLAVVTRRWKLREVDGLRQLFDLVEDPLEEVDLSGTPGLEEVEATLLAWLQQHAP